MVRLVILLAACTVNAPSMQGQKLVFGEECTVVSDTSTECSSGVCTDSFTAIDHPVCSEKCMIGSDGTCPEGSKGMMCSTQGLCSP